MNIKPDVEITEQYATKAQAAKVLSVSLRSIERFKKEGLPYVAKRGYPLIECLKWYNNRLRNNEDGPTIVDQKLRKLTAEADLLEIELAKSQGSVVAFDEISRLIIESHVALKNVFLGLPGRLAMDLAAETDAAVVRDKLMYEIKSAMNDASNRFREIRNNIAQAGVFVEHPAPPDADAMGGAESDTP